MLSASVKNASPFFILPFFQQQIANKFVIFAVSYSANPKIIIPIFRASNNSFSASKNSFFKINKFPMIYFILDFSIFLIFSSSELRCFNCSIASSMSLLSAAIFAFAILSFTSGVLSDGFHMKISSKLRLILISEDLVSSSFDLISFFIGDAITFRFIDFNFGKSGLRDCCLTLFLLLLYFVFLNPDSKAQLPGKYAILFWLKSVPNICIKHFYSNFQEQF